MMDLWLFSGMKLRTKFDTIIFFVVTIDITPNLGYILPVTQKVTTCTQKKLFEVNYEHNKKSFGRNCNGL